jgi:soluble lytic murein transglycosylase-like protein
MEFDLFGERRSNHWEKGGGVSKRNFWLDSALENRTIASLTPVLVFSRRYGVDTRLLKILCFIESRYRLDAVSPKGARGPMQFMPETAKRFGLKNPHDPREAFDAAARYMRELLRKFGGRLDLALAAYNAGEGTVESFQTGRPLVLANGKIINPGRQVTGGIPPYRETQDYVRSAIALLTNGQMTNAKPSAFLPQTSKSTRRANARILSLDSRNKKRRSSSPTTEGTKSLFIEVQ